MSSTSSASADASVMTCADMITRVFTNIERKDLERSNKVFGAWRRTVESIRPNGANLAAHSSIIDLKNGILLIEADHPGWIQLLQLRQKYILTGLRRLVPDLSIQSLAFRLRGSSAALHDVATLSAEARAAAEARERARMQQQLDREEAELEARGFGTKKPAPVAAASASPAANAEVASTAGAPTQSAAALPPELQGIFSRFRQEMKKK